MESKLLDKMASFRRWSGMMKTYGPLRALLITILFFIIGLVSDHAGFAANWRSLGPYGGDVNDLAVSPHDSKTVLAATRHGVYVSADGGDSWRLLGLATKDVQSVSVSSGDGKIFIAGSWDGSCHSYAHMSVDGGRIWTTGKSMVQDLCEGQVNKIVVDTLNPRKLHAATNSGIWLSPDAGISWIRSEIVERSRKIVVDTSSPDSLFAATERGIFHSSDGGAHWVSIRGDLPASLKLGEFLIDPRDSKTILAVVNGRVWNTADRGGHWQEGSIGLPSTGTVDRLAMSSLDSTVLLATMGTDVFKSSDQGLSWFRSGANPDATTKNSWQRAPLVYGIGNSTRGLMSPLRRGVLVTTDAGATWVPSIKGLANTYVTCLVNNSQEGLIVGAVRDGVWASKDVGNTWRFAGEGLPDNTRKYNYDEFAVNGITVSPSNTSSWKLATTWGVFSSSDSGASWKEIWAHQNLTSILSFPPGTETVLASAWMGNESLGGVFSSSAANSNWMLTTGAFDGLMVRQLLVNPWDSQQVVAVVSAYVFADRVWWDAILISSDGATTWTKKAKLPVGRFNVLMPFAQDRGVALAGTDCGVYKTIDLSTWTYSSTGMMLGAAGPCVSVYALQNDPTDTNRVYAGSDAGLWVSNDRGDHWTSMNSELVVPSVRALAFADDGKTLFVGTFGGGVWTVNTSEMNTVRRRLTR